MLHPYLRLALVALLSAFPCVAQAQTQDFLQAIKRHSLIANTVPENGDQNPYAIVVSPTDFGNIKKDDVLVSNFNNKNNLQGTGSTIVVVHPATKALSLFASIPRDLPECPGGAGLTTAMAVLKSGWVIVGSLPSQDGTTATKGQGCLIVLDAQGHVVHTITSPFINGPWGNMAVMDHGTSAVLFVSNTGFGIEAPGQDIVRKANVLRLEFSIPTGAPPQLVHQAVVADGFGEQANQDVFIIGPTGLALDATNDTLYVSDAIDNRIVAIPHATTRTDSAGVGQEITKGNLLKRPLAMIMAPNGHLLVTNGLNGQVVELDPRSGEQVRAQWIDPNKAQTPPGAGDLFGIAMRPEQDGFYYVEDEINALVLTH